MQTNETYELYPCPNCKQSTIPFSLEIGLLSDWCDSCDKSIFDDSPTELKDTKEQ